MFFHFSWSLLFSGLFTAYVFHSIYSIVGIYMPPSCTKGEGQHCINSFLETKPQLQLIIGTTHKSQFSSWNELTLVDQWMPFEYWRDIIVKNITIPVPKSTRNNGTLNIYAFAAPMPRPNEDKKNWVRSIETQTTLVAHFKLTQYLVPEAETFNLLNKQDETDENLSTTKAEMKKKKEKEKPIAHIAKKLRLTMLTDHLSFPSNALPEDFANLIRLVSSDTYLPPMRFDRFNSRIRDFYKVNESESEYELEFEFSSSSIGSIRMAFQFQNAMESMKKIGFSEKDLDEVKGVFADTNVYLLALTLFIASMHLLFDFLAFKNDVIYWKRRKTTAGLSFRTIIWRCFSQIVIFFYLMEEKSSMLVIIPAGIGSMIEVWKVSKAMKVTIVFHKGLPRLRFGQFSESEKATAQHDVESMKYLSYILYPLCIGGAVYSLLYTPHKSWYSWTLQSLVSGVYAFGFLFMLPQLFINYRLKSVAHLPWRAFMYKAFNTFIDDIFAFIITMPTAHRVACFRDDIVFLIYLYQRWLYPVDKTRIDAGGDVEYEAEAEGESKNPSGAGNTLVAEPKKTK